MQIASQPSTHRHRQTAVDNPAHIVGTERVHNTSSSQSLSIFLYREMAQCEASESTQANHDLNNFLSFSLSFVSSFIRWLSLICHTFNKCLCHSVLSADDDDDGSGGNGSGSSDCDSSANAVRRLSMRHYYYYCYCGMYPTGMSCCGRLRAQSTEENVMHQ